MASVPAGAGRLRPGSAVALWADPGRRLAVAHRGRPDAERRRARAPQPGGAGGGTVRRGRALPGLPAGGPGGHEERWGSGPHEEAEGGGGT